MVRQFKLINALGQEFDLMRKDAFFQTPSGLGFSVDFDVEPVGYDWIETDSQIDQKTVSGELVFTKYQGYQEFIRFCSQSPLSLCYCPVDTWYYIPCKLGKIDKGEFQRASRRLICPVDFICFGLWYESVQITQTQLGDNEGKIYAYTYPYTYVETAAGVAQLDNTGTLPSYAKLHIKGPCTNPGWALTVGGQVTVRGRVMAEIPAGNKLVVDSAPATMEIAEYTQDNRFVENLYPKSDFSTARFLTIPVGKSQITFSHEGVGPIDAFVEVRQLATSV